IAYIQNAIYLQTFGSKQLQDDRAALRQSEQLTENKVVQIEIELEFLRGLEFIYRRLTMKAIREARLISAFFSDDCARCVIEKPFFNANT
ncbi:hypothetical protein ACPTGY_14550, partial [Enterococcus faecalis]